MIHEALPTEDGDTMVQYRLRCSCGWMTYWARYDVAVELRADHLRNHAAAEVGAS